MVNVLHQPLELPVEGYDDFPSDVSVERFKNLWVTIVAEKRQTFGVPLRLTACMYYVDKGYARELNFWQDGVGNGIAWALETDIVDEEEDSLAQYLCQILDDNYAD